MVTHQPQRSLKHEYECFVEQEIENYKDSIPRSAILRIGEPAHVDGGLVVDTTLQRRGVGTHLVAAVADWARSRGAVDLFGRCQIHRIVRAPR